ncbi:hypothetical protein ACFE04_010176 [Oxalis oulophora]
MSTIQSYNSNTTTTMDSNNKVFSFPILIPILFLVDIILFNWVNFQKKFAMYWFILQSQFHSSKSQIELIKEDHDDDQMLKLKGCEMEKLMKNLGVFGETESVTELVNQEEILEVFEESEPSLEELKEAFDVFDVNRDGFIDETELQRVVCVLMGKGTELEHCRRMIATFDQNGDGKIDFQEFVRLMENDFC